MSLKCMTAFGILGAAAAGVIWFIVQVPEVLICLAISATFTWAIYTAIICLTHE